MSLIKYLFLLLAVSQSIVVARAAEVDGKMFVADPAARPIHVTDSSRIWPCQGFVNPQLMNIIFDELKILADAEGISHPKQSLCDYKIGTLNLFGNTVTLYQVEYYVSAVNRQNCLVNNYCDDTRSMTFKVRNGELHRQYMLTNVSKKLTRFACISMKGAIVDIKGGC